jgi:hypothetical protein
MTKPNGIQIKKILKAKGYDPKKFKVKTETGLNQTAAQIVFEQVYNTRLS